MANAPVEALNLPGGQTLTLKLFPSGSDTIANGAGGDTATESTNRKGHYVWTVTEGLSGLHSAHIHLADGTHFSGGYVQMSDDTSVHRIGGEFDAVLAALVSLQGHGDSSWATAAGFAVPGSAMTLSDGAITSAKIANGAITDAKITVPAVTGVATGILAMIVQLWRRFFKKSVLSVDDANIKTYADDGTTVLTTQTIADSGGTQTQGAAT